MRTSASRCPAFVLAVLAVVGGAGGCLEQPDCAFSCDQANPACPGGYECRGDGLCHRVGSSACGELPAPDGAAPDAAPADGAPCETGGACGCGGSACSGDQSCCDGACADTTSDVLHCGDCSHACDVGGDWCIASSCRPDYAWARWLMPSTGSYTVNGDVVTAQVTQLKWQKGTAMYYVTQPAAAAYCGQQTLGGLSGWRLPTRIELLSLVDDGKTGPAFGAALTGDSDWYWSDSAAANASGIGWAVNFADGEVATLPATALHLVRCVNSEGVPGASPTGAGAPPGRYELTPETAKDLKTALTWQRGDATPRPFADAYSYCDTLTLAGASTWRLPTVKELLTIIDERGRDPAVDPAAFGGTQAAYYWSASLMAGPVGTMGAWAVDFSRGDTQVVDRGTSYRVRCVR
jgi:hypothetical protein